MSTAIISRADFQQLSEVRLEEAKTLLDAGKWDGAYYLAGYAVELALKACIIKRLMATDAFPEKRLTENCYTHELKKLFGVAGLEASFAADRQVDPILKDFWEDVVEWSEHARYQADRRGGSERTLRGGCGPRTRSMAMDPNALVNDQLDRGREILERLRKAELPIAVAFWAKFPETADWHLYIASPWVTEGRRHDASRLVREIRHNAPELDLGSSDVRLIRSDDSRTLGALEAIKPLDPSKPYRGIKRFTGSSFNGVEVEGAYIYPLTDRTVETRNGTHA